MGINIFLQRLKKSPAGNRPSHLYACSNAFTHKMLDDVETSKLVTPDQNAAKRAPVVTEVVGHERHGRRIGHTFIFLDDRNASAINFDLRGSDQTLEKNELQGVRILFDRLVEQM